jgi:hypothetical protein
MSKQLGTVASHTDSLPHLPQKNRPIEAIEASHKKHCHSSNMLANNNLRSNWGNWGNWGNDILSDEKNGEPHTAPIDALSQ